MNICMHLNFWANVKRLALLLLYKRQSSGNL